jgi:hypothetical protein
MTVSREEVAAEIDAANRRCPTRPSDVPETGAETFYLRARLAEVVKAYRDNGIKGAMVNVSCPASLLPVLREVTSVEGIPVCVEPFYPGEFEEKGAAAYLVSVDAIHPATVWVRPALGFAFPGPVSESYWTTRWVLQEVDGVDGGTASEIAERL